MRPERVDAPAGIDVAVLASRTSYHGSAEHKDYLSAAGPRQNNRCFEARLSNREQGVYKGYPLKPDEIPSWL